jgi:hypothetical protein
MEGSVCVMEREMEGYEGNLRGNFGMYKSLR